MTISAILIGLLGLVCMIPACACFYYSHPDLFMPYEIKRVYKRVFKDLDHFECIQKSNTCYTFRYHWATTGTWDICCWHNSMRASIHKAHTCECLFDTGYTKSASKLYWALVSRELANPTETVKTYRILR